MQFNTIHKMRPKIWFNNYLNLVYIIDNLPGKMLTGKKFFKSQVSTLEKRENFEIKMLRYILSF